jgi:hypothetical protein
MHRSAVEHALRLGALLAFVALAAVACGAREEAKPRPLPEEERRLQPGAYRSEEFEPSLSFEVRDGWTNVPPEAHDVLVLTRGEEAAFAFVNAQQVCEPGRRSGLPTVARAPEDMVG